MRTWVVERQWIVTARTAAEALTVAQPDEGTHERVNVYEAPARTRPVDRDVALGLLRLGRTNELDAYLRDAIPAPDVEHAP